MHDKATLINQTNIRLWAFEGHSYATTTTVFHTADAASTGPCGAGGTVHASCDVVAVEVSRVDMLGREDYAAGRKVSRFSMLRSNLD